MLPPGSRPQDDETPGGQASRTAPSHSIPEVEGTGCADFAAPQAGGARAASAAGNHKRNRAQKGFTKNRARQARVVAFGAASSEASKPLPPDDEVNEVEDKHEVEDEGEIVGKSILGNGPELLLHSVESSWTKDFAEPTGVSGAQSSSTRGDRTEALFNSVESSWTKDRPTGVSGAQSSSTDRIQTDVLFHGALSSCSRARSTDDLVRAEAAKKAEEALQGFLNLGLGTSLGARLARYEAELRAQASEPAVSVKSESESERKGARELDLSRVFAEGESDFERERVTSRERELL